VTATPDNDSISSMVTSAVHHNSVSVMTVSVYDDNIISRVPLLRSALVLLFSSQIINHPEMTKTPTPSAGPSATSS
jgi:hypothetical protein